MGLSELAFSFPALGVRAGEGSWGAEGSRATILPGQGAG